MRFQIIVYLELDGSKTEREAKEGFPNRNYYSCEVQITPYDANTLDDRHR